MDHVPRRCHACTDGNPLQAAFLNRVGVGEDAPGSPQILVDDITALIQWPKMLIHRHAALEDGLPCRVEEVRTEPLGPLLRRIEWQI